MHLNSSCALANIEMPLICDPMPSIRADWNARRNACGIRAATFSPSVRPPPQHLIAQRPRRAAYVIDPANARAITSVAALVRAHACVLVVLVVFVTSLDIEKSDGKSSQPCSPKASGERKSVGCFVDFQAIFQRFA